MQANEIVRALLDEAQIKPWSASKAMGERGAYLDSMLHRGSTPRLDTAARIADVCGYDLILRPRGGGREIAVDPARPGAGDRAAAQDRGERRPGAL